MWWLVEVQNICGRTTIELFLTPSDFLLHFKKYSKKNGICLPSASTLVLCEFYRLSKPVTRILRRCNSLDLCGVYIGFKRAMHSLDTR